MYVSKQFSLAAVNYLLDSVVRATASDVSKLLNDVTYFFCRFTVYLL